MVIKVAVQEWHRGEAHHSLQSIFLAGNVYCHVYGQKNTHCVSGHNFPLYEMILRPCDCLLVYLAQTSGYIAKGIMMASFSPFLTANTMAALFHSNTMQWQQNLLFSSEKDAICNSLRAEAMLGHFKHFSEACSHFSLRAPLEFHSLGISGKFCC